MNKFDEFDTVYDSRLNEWVVLINHISNSIFWIAVPDEDNNTKPYCIVNENFLKTPSEVTE